MTDAERGKSILGHQAALDRVEDQLVIVGSELEQRFARLQTSQANVWRDGIGAGVGIALAAPTSGYSLLVTFWTMTALLVDVLDVFRERRAIHELAHQLRLLLRRQADIEADIDSLEKNAP